MHVKGNKAKNRFMTSQTFLKHQSIKDSTPAPQIGFQMREVFTQRNNHPNLIKNHVSKGHTQNSQNLLCWIVPFFFLVSNMFL